MSNSTRFMLRATLCLAAALVAVPNVVRADPTCQSQTIAISNLSSSGMTVVMPASSAGECSMVTITGATLVSSGEALTSLHSPTDILTAINGGSGISICFASGAGDTSVCPMLTSPGVVAPIKLTKNGQWEIGTLQLRLTNGEIISIKVESQVSTGADHFHIVPTPVPEPGTLLMVGTGLLALARKFMP